MSLVEERLRQQGWEVPTPPAPVAAYVPGVKVGRMVYTSGQLPFWGGELKYRGKLGEGVTAAEGYEAARLCALNCLGVIKALAGDLDRVERVVKVTGFVASAPGFHEQPQVVNGASELLVQAFGEAGQHARSAVGVAELPRGACCEVEVTVLLKEE